MWVPYSLPAFMICALLYSFVLGVATKNRILRSSAIIFPLAIVPFLFFSPYDVSVSYTQDTFGPMEQSNCGWNPKISANQTGELPEIYELGLVSIQNVLGIVNNLALIFTGFGVLFLSSISSAQQVIRRFEKLCASVILILSSVVVLNAVSNINLSLAKISLEGYFACYEFFYPGLVFVQYGMICIGLLTFGLIASTEAVKRFLIK